MEAGATIPTLVDRVHAYAADFVADELGADPETTERVQPYLEQLVAFAQQPNRHRTFDTLFEFLAAGHALHAAAAAVAEKGNHARAGDVHALAQSLLECAAQDLAFLGQCSVREQHEGEWVN